MSTTGIATIILALVALYAAENEYFRKFFFKIKIVFEDIKIVEREDCIISRLILKNLGSSPARKSVVFVKSIANYNEEEGDWNEVEDYIPYPLRWTHFDKIEKDIYPKNLYMLDLCKINKEGEII
ncbi:MAG: hypothetical protein ACOC5T_10325, partial [Elusimicrobiota bacterium]